MGTWYDEPLEAIQEQINKLQNWVKQDRLKLSTDFLSIAEMSVNEELKKVKQSIKKQNDLITKIISTEESIIHFQGIEAKKLQDIESSKPVYKVLKEFVADWERKEIDRYMEMLNRDSWIGISKSDVEFLELGKEEMLKQIKNDFEFRLYTLIIQIKEKTGEVKECYLKRNPNGGFDGTIHGEKTNVRIETVLAGGHNIQQLHYRTLINVIH